MKNFLTSLLLLFLFNSAFSQATYKIDGAIEDTLGNALIYATVLLLEKSDSTMVDFTRTEMDGSFRFKDVSPGNHLVKSTYLGYLPLTVDASSTGENVKLGTLKMTEIAAELMEVVIKAAKAPMKMRGDTIEYDATTFQVPEGSTVEDLLRRLPGIEVEADGTINADGQEVNEVTVDGKSFFGSDPKAATKNLPAEGISKVQVFDSKTEEEEVTGAASTGQDKTMNLELKEEFKSGGFGKVIAGAGDESRRELKGNYNKFNKKIQFSLVGVGNNTGRNGLSWDDYQDFMGSQSWNFGDDSDYGFGGRSHYYTLSGSGGIESSIQSLFFTGTDSGLPENYNLGANFNYDHNKTKLSSVYYYNQAGLLAKSSMDQDKFFPAFTQSEIRSSKADDLSKGHRAELNFEKEIDSLHTIKLEMNGAIINDTKVYDGSSSLSKDNLLTSSSLFSNNTTTDGKLFNGLALFRKKFKKKGRSMGINFSYLATELTDDWTQDSNTEFFDNQAILISTLNIDQENNNKATKNLFKGNFLYVEPIGNKFYSQTFYNRRNRIETGERAVFDQVGDIDIANKDLSRSYENNIVYNRAGTSLRYSHGGINISVGAAYQHFDLNGDFRSLLTDTILGTVDRQFGNIIPNVSMNLNPNRNTYINMGYSRNAGEPDIKDLQPLVDNTNPLFIKVGNPNLQPELANDISMYASKSFPLHDMRLNFNTRFSIYERQFSTSESVDENLITTYTPITVDGGSNLYASIRYSVPIIKNKIKVRTHYSYGKNNRLSIVNDTDNETTVNTHTPELKFDITPSEHMSIYLTSRYTLSDTKYSVDNSQNQKTNRIKYSAQVNTKLFAGFFITSTFNYDKYTNDRFNLDREIPIWNTSLYRHFMKGNQLELRFSLYDALNKSVGFNQSAYGISVSQSETEAIGRYGMFSVTYNIRGMKTDVRKDSWW